MTNKIIKYLEDEIKAMKDILSDFKYKYKKAHQEANDMSSRIKKLNNQIIILNKALIILKNRGYE